MIRKKGGHTRGRDVSYSTDYLGFWLGRVSSVFPALIACSIRLDTPSLDYYL